jgi:hypothetical protein
MEHEFFLGFFFTFDLINGNLQNYQNTNVTEMLRCNHNKHAVTQWKLIDCT